MNITMNISLLHFLFDLVLICTGRLHRRRVSNDPNMAEDETRGDLDFFQHFLIDILTIIILNTPK